VNHRVDLFDYNQKRDLFKRGRANPLIFDQERNHFNPAGNSVHIHVYVWPHVMYISSRDSSYTLDFSTSVHMNDCTMYVLKCAPHVGYKLHVQVTSYKEQKKLLLSMLLLLLPGTVTFCVY